MPSGYSTTVTSFQGLACFYLPWRMISSELSHCWCPTNQALLDLMLVVQSHCALLLINPRIHCLTELSIVMWAYQGSWCTWLKSIQSRTGGSYRLGRFHSVTIGQKQTYMHTQLKQGAPSRCLDQELGNKQRTMCQPCFHEWFRRRNNFLVYVWIRFIQNLLPPHLGGQGKIWLGALLSHLVGLIYLLKLHPPDTLSRMLTQLDSGSISEPFRLFRVWYSSGALLLVLTFQDPSDLRLGTPDQCLNTLSNQKFNRL